VTYVRFSRRTSGMHINSAPAAVQPGETVDFDSCMKQKPALHLVAFMVVGRDARRQAPYNSSPPPPPPMDETLSRGGHFGMLAERAG